jgi:hypothetical protein
MKITVNGIELAVVDCLHWSPSGGNPECLAGHDLSQCGSCSFRKERPQVRSQNLVPHTRDQQRNRIRGLGDLIAAGTRAVGIRPCGGCKKRQEALNRMVPFGKKDNNGGE